MKINLAKNLQPIKESALANIDAQAERIRSEFITLTPGQVMIYALKEKEAESVCSDPGINPAYVPHIASEAGLAGISLLDQAAIVLSMANNWRNVSSVIEGERLSRKDLIRKASNPGEIAAVEIIDWSKVLAGFVKSSSP